MPDEIVRCLITTRCRCVLTGKDRRAACAQKTPAVWAFVKTTPRAASRSRFGVKARGVVSRHPIQSFISSTARNRTLGFASSAATPRQLARTSAVAASSRFISRSSSSLFSSVSWLTHGFVGANQEVRTAACRPPAWLRPAVPGPVRSAEHRRDRRGRCGFVAGR